MLDGSLFLAGFGSRGDFKIMAEPECTETVHYIDVTTVSEQLEMMLTHQMNSLEGLSFVVGLLIAFLAVSVITCVVIMFKRS